ncbi:hypothetical protein AYO21_08685 [Fonsecaea monophora]|uniref:Vacuolar protein sorting-associated protein 74 n=1 Tax=Fonsecaea monophora TaxID=254056 RepID=A0A177F0W3_9EURO|nr:hypothetical protein AYO21_08685 [Fonsecaea monophora]OAG37150.1 hypothetical protein AYO21_08685 [Fonsecaea monophora]
MASQGGLTRRRGAGGATSPNGEDESSSRVTSPVPKPYNDRSPETAYESSENGHRIAYDPRDISESAERSKQPKLTLMEEVLLLGLKDKQGYLSFWNDNISYALRGCIVIELAFRGRISMQKDSSRRRFPLSDRIIEVIDDTLTGEVLCDEALKMMKTSEKMSVSSWIDLMSGETWNLMKIGYQLKQVRERLAKGLVDKGILRTEKRNFLLFDMATHPVVDSAAKDEIRKRVRNVCTSRTVVLPPSQFLPAELDFRMLRTVSMVCAAYAANVLENALVTLGHEARERAFAQVDELLAEYSQWPFAKRTGGQQGIGANIGQVIADEVEKNKDKELQLEAQSTASRTWTIDSNTSTIRDNRERALIPATNTAGSRSRRETSRYDDRDGSHVAHERGDYGSSLSRSRTLSTTTRSRGDGRRDNRDGDSSVVELSDLFGSMSMANTSSSRRSYRGDSGQDDTPALSLITLFTCTRHSVAQCPNTVGAEARRRAATDDRRPSRPARHEIPFRRLLAHHDVKRRDVKMTYHEQDHEIDLELPDWFLIRVPPGNLVCRDDGWVWSVCDACLANEGGWRKYSHLER